jgi:sugar O-acyltransferase (sialic acid O-acetyltransferase NeuD family)
MSKPVVIVGAGRQGRLVAETWEKGEAPDPVAGFLDDTKAVNEDVIGYPVLAGFAAMHNPSFVRDHAWFVAIGDNTIRTNLCRTLADAGADFVNVIHPDADISRTATLGRGVFLSGLNKIGSRTRVGDWVILGAYTCLGLDISIREGMFAGPGVFVAGGGSVGARSFLGAGTIVSNEVSIGADCVVGAKSLVLRDLPDGTTAYGIPARAAPLKRQPLQRR